MDTAAKTVTVASASGVEEMSYDALVLAPGAVAIRPPLPGLDSPGFEPFARSPTP
ncbi:hypothetical protein [Microbacterium schleiferi]|uniref:hypothetical protein n=1 Tax=Microbacterium schleiferi TaxID=69362 RepID=UPI002B4BE59B|nr:hypothetical protein [Microbacterium schleiferi]